MNERIKELLYEAGGQYGGENHLTGKTRVYTDDVDYEKFAELIVQECIGVVKNLSPGYEDYRNQIEDAFRRDCVEEIKQHFGVNDEVVKS